METELQVVRWVMLCGGILLLTLVIVLALVWRRKPGAGLVTDPKQAAPDDVVDLRRTSSENTAKALTELTDLNIEEARSAVEEAAVAGESQLAGVAANGEESVDVYFLDKSLLQLPREARLYPWTKLGSSLGLRLASVHRDDDGRLVLRQTFQSKAQDWFGILTGGILSAIFSAAFSRERCVALDRDHIERLVRVSVPTEVGFTWSDDLKADPPDHQVVYHLFAANEEGGTDGHVFSLAYKNWLSTRDLFEQAQAALDALVLTVVPAGLVSDEDQTNGSSTGRR